MAESAVFINILRYERSQSVKKNINHDHRNNYYEFNKSGIFAKPTENLKTEKSRELVRNKTVSGFIPTYDDLTNSQRKAKEFYKDKVINPKKTKDVNSLTNNTRQLHSQNIIKEPLEKPSKVLTSLDVKLKQLYPDLSYAEIEKIKNKNTKRFTEAPKVNNEKNITSRQRKIENMHSNIFNDPNKKGVVASKKTLETKKSENVLKTKEVTSTKNTNSEKKLEKFKTASLFDWNKTNTELAFKTKPKGNEKQDPKMKKMNNLKSAFDSDKYSNVVIETVKLETTISDKLDTEVTTKVRETLRNDSKSRRQLDNISYLHDKEFYKQTLRKHSSHKNIERCEVDNIDYEKFNEKEFKSIYLKNGIHIYDVNLNGNYGNGNVKGSISFKVRKNEDIEGYNKKLTEVNEKVKSKYKTEVKCNDNRNLKPISDTLPCNIDWTTTDVNSFSKNRNLQKSVHKIYKNTLDSTEKYSGKKTPFDISYKNDKSGKKVFLKS